MNVFVLCSGRCGSLTFARACEHITNYSTGHESRDGELNASRFAYPDRHIEIDNRLSWMLGRLDREFGNKAVYVHLTRNTDDVVQSHCAKVYPGTGLILNAYEAAIIRAKGRSKEAVCWDYLDTVDANIRLFLKDKPNQMPITIETAGQDLPAFWRLIGAEGNLDAALAELGKRHNAG